MAGNPAENAQFGVLSETRGLRLNVSIAAPGAQAYPVIQSIRKIGKSGVRHHGWNLVGGPAGTAFITDDRCSTDDEFGRNGTQTVERNVSGGIHRVINWTRCTRHGESARSTAHD